MRLYKGIKKLYTFSNFAFKQGRHSLAKDLTFIENAILLEHKGRVVWIGTEKEFFKNKLLSKKIKSVLNLKAKTVFPSFIECHTHLIFAGDRQNEFEMRNQGTTYQDISAQGGGILSTVRATERAKDNELLKLAQTRIDRFVEQGVSVVEVKTGYGLNHKNEIRLLNLIHRLKRAHIVPTFLGPHSRSTSHSDLSDYMQEIISKTLPYIKKKQLCRRVDMFVEKGFFDLTMARQYIQAAQDFDFDLTVHAEQLSLTGAAELFVSKKAKSVDHLVCLDDQGIKKLAQSTTTGVLLPLSDFYLKINYPPARALIDSGARVALSTDFNPGTAPSQDLSLVGVLARLEMKMSLAEVFSAWTVGAAYALGLENDFGSLEVGKMCNFVVSDEPLEAFFYQVGHHPVRETRMGIV